MKRNLTFEIWNPALTERYASMDHLLENIEYGSVDPGGYSTFRAEVKLDPRLVYPELTVANIIRAYHGENIVWEGRLSTISRNISDMVRFGIEADGFSERLNSRFTTVSVGAEKGSTWMTDHLLTDSDLGLQTGTISTLDYTFPANGIDASPRKTYADMLQAINAPNGWSYGVWAERAFSFAAKSASPAYIVDITDCDSELEYGLENIINYLFYSYTADGGTYAYSTLSDAASIAMYGRRDGELEIPGKATAAQALQIATVYLNERKVMRPRSAVVARRIFDTQYNEVPIYEVPAGPAVFIEGLFPGELSITAAWAINEMSTFNIVESVVDVTGGTVSLSPGDYASQASRMVARRELAA